MAIDDPYFDVLDIKPGGTNANNVKDARLNLGFTYGTTYNLDGGTLSSDYPIY